MKRLPFDYAVRNLGRSPLRLALSLAGSALVVMLVLAAGAFVRGMENSLRQTGGDRNVILLGAGSEESFERSEISPTVPGEVAASVRGIKTRLDIPFVSPEIYLEAMVTADAGGPEIGPVTLRGVKAEAFVVHTQVRLVEGRIPEPGHDQILVGANVAGRLGLSPDRLAVGQTLRFDDRVWTISGRFIAPGTVMEAEIWAPLAELQLAARRENLSCVVLTLDDTGEIDDVDVFVKRRLDLELVAMSERQYYHQLSDFFRPIQMMVWATALLIAVGGLLGGLNTMYAAFAGRVRELGTLQSLGFGRSAIVVSLVQESLLAAAGGTLLAVLMSLVLLDGRAVRFSMGVFGLSIDANVMLQGLAAGLLLGLIGAIPPAVRCLRLPIATALKAE